MRELRRVVVTGLGTVTPWGVDLTRFWDGLLAGESGVSRIERFTVDAFPVRIAAEVKDFDPNDFMERRDWRMMDRFIQFGMAAGLLAWSDAALSGEAVDLERVGVAIGTGVGGQETFQAHEKLMADNGVRAVPPYHLPMFLPNMAAAQLSMRLGARGPSTTVATACASSANAIGDAYRLIQLGDADVMLAGGTEAALHPMGLAGFCAARALSRRNDDPAAASRPFDRDRDGFVLGEGAAVLILEELNHAQARGARIYAEVVGYGMSSDAHNPTIPLPDGSGAARCMRNAIRDAQISPDQIDYVNAHGTATKIGDAAETKAVKEVFGAHAEHLACGSTKSMTGHLLGAAGALESVITVLAVHSGQLPPTINLENPDEGCDLDYVAGKARHVTTRYALTNSFAFGGHNAALVFAGHRPTEEEQVIQ